MNKEYEICKKRLRGILEESDSINVLRGRESDIDETIKSELRNKFPEYLAHPEKEDSRYERIAEDILINFCDKGEVFRKKSGEKFKLLERFEVTRYRYFANEAVK